MVSWFKSSSTSIKRCRFSVVHCAASEPASENRGWRIKERGKHTRVSVVHAKHALALFVLKLEAYVVCIFHVLAANEIEQTSSGRDIPLALHW